MTYEATVQFKFDATFTHTYGSFLDADDYIPEEHYLITAPASDLNCKQYFRLFEKFLLCVGMDPASIRSSAMSLVFNDCVREEDQRKVCKEYELTMDEDLHAKYQEWKKLDAAFEHHKENVVSEPKIKEEWAHPESGIYKHRQQYTEEEMNAMCERAATENDKDKCREYNLREAEYYNKRAKIDLQQQKNLIGKIDEL